MALLLMVAFLGMTLTVVPVVFGEPPKDRERTKYHDTALLVGPPLALLIALGILGLWLPQPLYRLVTEAAHLLEVIR
jgi:hydrogenase-4 component F